MATLLVNDNCGCATSAENWDTLTVQFMTALQKAIGYSPQIGNAYNELVLLVREGGGSGQYQQILNYIVRVGAPSSTVSTPIDEDTVILSVNNGYSFTIPAMIGYSIVQNVVYVDSQPLTPTTDRYYYDPSTGYFDFAYELVNVLVTFSAFKLVDTPDPDPSMLQFNSNDFFSSDFA